MRASLVAAIAALLWSPSLAFAEVLNTQTNLPQTAAPIDAPGANATPMAASKSPPELPLGAPVQLEIVDAMSSATAIVGQEIALRLVEPISANGQILVPAGTPGIGVVLDVQKNGLAGLPGLITAAGSYLDFDGAHIPLEGMIIGGAGQNHVLLSHAAISAIGVFSVFIRGQEFEVAAGTRVTARLAGGPPEVAAPVAGLNPVAAPPPGKAMIVFYHQGHMRSEIYTYGVSENGVLLASLKGNQYLAVPVDPGMHEFQNILPFTHRPGTATLHQQILEGQTAFIRNDNEYLTPGNVEDFQSRHLRDLGAGAH